MTFEAVDELPSVVDAAGRAADSTEPKASAAVKAIEARCFKAVTPIFSHVPFSEKRHGDDKVPFSG